MKVVFILVVTAFTICLNRELPRHRHKEKFPQRRETRQQDAYIGPKPGTQHNRLFPEYGTNFRYVGEVKHGLDRVTLVTSIPIPKYSDIKKKPLDFNCTIDLSRKEAKTYGSYQYRVHEYCAKVQPYIKYMQTQQKSLVHSLRQLLIHDLYAALPELHPEYEVQSDKHDESPSSLPEDEKELNRERRGIGAIFSSVLPGLITLAVESLTSWINGKQQNRIHQAVDKMRKTELDVKNTTQYQEDFLMYGKYSVESLNKVIDTLNSLHDKHTELEKLVTTKVFTEVESIGDALDYSVELQLFLAMAQEEHVTKYKGVFKAGKELLDAIAILSQRRLPRSLFPDQRIEGILAQVDKMVRLRYPDYELAANHISHYRDMELVTFSVDRITHSLVVTFPVFIKDYKQPPLSLFEIETVPVPIPDRNKQADSYSQVRIQKDYIAAGMDYYIQIRMTEMLMCKSIGYIYYCEELFVVKHKSKHSCASAIFYELGPSQVIKNCKFDYMYNETVPPVILDGGKDILLANFQGPRSLKCTSVNGGLAKPAPEHTYAVVDREFLCDCKLDLEHASVLRQLSSCNRERSSKLVMQFHVNIAFWELLRERSPQTAELVQPKFTDHRQIFEVKLFERKPRRIDQPTDLETFIEKIDKNGKRIPSKSMIENKTQFKPLLPRWINNILVIISTVVSTILALPVLVLLTKHFKIKSLLATLVLSTLPPPPEATAFKYDLGQTNLSENSVLKILHMQFPKTGIETYTHIPDKLCENCKISQRTKGLVESMNRPKALTSVESKAPAEPRKVVCSYPITTMWSNVLGSMIICYAIVRYIKPMTWYRGYKYSRNCTFYLFIFTDHYYSPLKICPLRGHLQNYKIEDSGTDLELTLHKNWIYDTVNISWGDIQVLENEIPIKLPRTVSITLRHKIKNRRMMSFEWDVQYMVKQGPNWYNLTRTYQTKRKAVSFANLHDTDEEENSSLCERVTVRKEPIVKEVLI